MLIVLIGKLFARQSLCYLYLRSYPGNGTQNFLVITDILLLTTVVICSLHMTLSTFRDIFMNIWFEMYLR